MDWKKGLIFQTKTQIKRYQVDGREMNETDFVASENHDVCKEIEYSQWRERESYGMRKIDTYQWALIHVKGSTCLPIKRDHYIFLSFLWLGMEENKENKTDEVWSWNSKQLKNHDFFHSPWWMVILIQWLSLNDKHNVNCNGGRELEKKKKILTHFN